MKLKKHILIILIIVFCSDITAQNNNELVNKKGTYTDFVANEKGQRLQGITVRVRGNASTDITDFNGEFTVNAKKGDLIILSKNGVRINSYVYDGSLQYDINDESEDEVSKDDYRFSKRKKSKQDKFKTELDSANYYLNKDQDKSIQFVEKALKSTKNKTEIAKSYEVLADNYFKLKQFDLAKSNYETASVSLKKSISLQLKLAETYYFTNNLDQSKKLFNKILKNKKSTSYQKITAFEGLGTTYKSLKKYDLANLNYQNGLQLAKKHLVTPKITSINSKIAEVYNLQGNINQTNLYLNNSIKSAKKENREKTIVQSNKAADFYGSNNDFKEEIKLRKDNLKEFEESELDEIVVENAPKVTKQSIKYEIGNALANQKNYNEAINFYKESATDANSLDDVETEQKAIQGLTKVYVALGDDANALFNYKKLHKLTDLIYKQKEDKIKEVAKISNELLTKQTRINSLELERKLSDNKLKLFTSEQDLISENNKRQKLIIYSLLSGLLLLLLSLFYMYRANKQRKLTNNLLALKSLRSQMNPHFIFNALNSVNSFIASNDERTANRYLTDFSTLMRSVLENSDHDFISLEKEMELLSLYLTLEHSRFKDKFDFELNIDDKVKINEFKIPPMLLQPYVENAVWHGLRYKSEKGLLQVNVSQINSETLQIEIIDNGIGRKKSKTLKSKNQLKQKSKGMQNIKQRVIILNEMYKDKVDVLINDLHEDESGTKVVLTLLKD